MRFRPDDKFWVVTYPGPESVLDDILFQISLRELELQFRGGLTMAANLTIFTEEGEARLEARQRLRA